MMQIVYFSEKDVLLTHIRGLESEKVFITPSPQKADTLRSRLDPASAHDVITISKFTGNLLKGLWPQEDQRPVMKRKSELLLIFGVLKNRFLPDLGYEQFIQAYNLFSDLRSYSLDLNALSTVLEEQPSEIKLAVQMFWMVLSEMKILDEHGAYQAISEQLRTSEESSELKKAYIFWGFQHLNGQQIDLLKSLSLRYQVVIPFPLSLKENLKRSDWISWIIDHKVEEVELQVQEKTPEAKWIVVNSREMSRYLNKFGENSEVVLGVSKLTPSHTDLVPFNNVSFKVPLDLLDNELTELAHELESDSPDDLTGWLQNKFAEAVSNQSYKLLRIIQLYQESIYSISVLSDELPHPDRFFQKLLQEVVALNCPRSSLVPVFNQEDCIQLRDLSMLEDIDRRKKVIFCVDDRFDDFQGLGQQYPEPIQRALLSLGPIKRNELELLFKRWELMDLFATSDVTILMPEAVQKHSLIWKKVFNGVNLVRIEVPDKSMIRVPKDHFESRPKKSFDEHFSASKFQTYFDCPRKFYYGLVERLFPDVVMEGDINNKVSGTLVHRIIQFYFERGLSEEELPQVVKEVLDEEILKARLKIPAIIYADREVTFTHRARNGIRLLKDLELVSGQTIKWTIEQKFDYEDKYHIKGSIDCVGVSDTHVWLLDFKSSKSSASTNTEVNSIESLQLWVYTLAAEKIVPDFKSKSLIHGYVVLDEPKKSNIFFEDEDLKKSVSSADICAPTAWSGDCRELLDEARAKLETLALTIKADTHFITRPRNEKACLYCELSPVCTKGEVGNGRT